MSRPPHTLRATRSAPSPEDAVSSQKKSTSPLFRALKVFKVACLWVLWAMSRPLVWLWQILSPGGRATLVLSGVLVLGLAVFFVVRSDGLSSGDVAVRDVQISDEHESPGRDLGPVVDLSPGEDPVLSFEDRASGDPFVFEQVEEESVGVVVQHDVSRQGEQDEAVASVPVPLGLRVWQDAFDRLEPVSFSVDDITQDVESVSFVFVNVEHDASVLDGLLTQRDGFVRVVPVGTSALSMLVGQIPVCMTFGQSGVLAHDNVLSLWERSHDFVLSTLSEMDRRLSSGEGRVETDRWLEQSYAEFVGGLSPRSRERVQSCIWSQMDRLEDAVAWVLSQSDEAPVLPFVLSFDEESGLDFVLP